MADRQKLVQDFARSALAAVAAKGNGRAAAHGVAAADASGSSNSVKSIKVPVTEQWKSFQVESKARSLRDRKDRELLRTCFAVWSMQRLKVGRQTARDNALLVKYAWREPLRKKRTVSLPKQDECPDVCLSRKLSRYTDD